MKKRRKHLSSPLRWLTRSILAGIFLLLSNTMKIESALATVPASTQPTSTHTTEDCRLSPTPDECYHKKSYARSPYNPGSALSALPPLTTETIGLSGLKR